MRLTALTVALLIGLAPALHAQESQKSFTGKGASEAAACDAAKKAAKDWVKAGKSEGRARSLLDDGNCNCTGAAGAMTCTLDVRVSDEQHEEEEEG